MPRRKEEFKLKKKNRDDDSDDLIDDDDKKVKKSKVKPPKKDDEDELSELELAEEDINQIEDPQNNKKKEDINPLEDFQNNDKRPKKEVVNPKSPIGELSTSEILSFLIKRGEDQLNPRLRSVSLNLLLELTGRRRRPRNYGGSKTSFNRPFQRESPNNRDSMQNNRGPLPINRGSRPHKVPGSQDIYDERGNSYSH